MIAAYRRTGRTLATFIVTAICHGKRISVPVGLQPDADGREQAFLEDGQSVTLRGTAPGANGSVIDFGECVGTITPATGGAQ